MIRPRLMFEVWLRANRRIFAFAALLPAFALLVGMALIVSAWGDASRVWPRAAGAVLIGIALVGLLLLHWQARLARLACDGSNLLVNLGSVRPIAVPLEVVEGFLLGQGPSFLPGKNYEQAEVANLVVRLAERAAEWERVEVNRQLGLWCGHYITIRGTWCEPLNLDLVNRLNRRLAEIKQSRGEVGQ